MDSNLETSKSLLKRKFKFEITGPISMTIPRSRNNWRLGDPFAKKLKEQEESTDFKWVRKLVKTKVLTERSKYQYESYLKRLKSNEDYVIAPERFRKPPEKAFPPKEVYEEIEEYVYVKVYNFPFITPQTPQNFSVLKSFQFRASTNYLRFQSNFRNRIKRIRTASHFIRIKSVHNNIFLNLTLRNHSHFTRASKRNLTNIGGKNKKLRKYAGKTLRIMNTGLAGYKGPKRSSLVAAEDAGRALGRELHKRRIRQFTVVFQTIKDKKVFSALKGVINSNKFKKLRIKSYSYSPRVPHSKGLRAPKQRRV